MNWKKELKPISELIAALLLSFILVLGFIYNVSKPLWDYRKLSLVGRFEATLQWYEDMIIQTVYVLFYVLRHVLVSVFYFVTFRFWKAIKHLFHEVARGIDLLGNVLAGEMIEDFITPVEKTYFGLGKITISAATGYVEHLASSDPKAMNKFGWFITRSLNKSFNEEKHSIWSWEREIKDHPLYGRTDYFDLSI